MICPNCGGNVILEAESRKDKHYFSCSQCNYRVRAYLNLKCQCTEKGSPMDYLPRYDEYICGSCGNILYYEDIMINLHYMSYLSEDGIGNIQEAQFNKRRNDIKMKLTKDVYST